MYRKIILIEPAESAPLLTVQTFNKSLVFQSNSCAWGVLLVQNSYSRNQEYENSSFIKFPYKSYQQFKEYNSGNTPTL